MDSVPALIQVWDTSLPVQLNGKASDSDFPPTFGLTMVATAISCTYSSVRVCEWAIGGHMDGRFGVISREVMVRTQTRRKFEYVDEAILQKIRGWDALPSL
jgi:hypothetical protein